MPDIYCADFFSNLFKTLHLKVEQQDYFECVCGGYLPEDMDDK